MSSAMARPLSRSALDLRIATRPRWHSSQCPFALPPRQTVILHQRRPYASTRKTGHGSPMRDRPSMKVLQTDMMRNLSVADVPEDLRILKLTYVLPPAPSLFSNPSLWLQQRRIHYKQWLTEQFQLLGVKLLFWKNVPRARRPAHLKRSLFLGWIPFLNGPPKIPLELLRRRRTIRDLFARSYKALQHAAETGSTAAIRDTCGAQLASHYDRRAKTFAARREVLDWQLKSCRVRILSNKFAILPFDVEGCPAGFQCMVARVRSQQKLTTGQVVGKRRDGERDVQWREPKLAKTTDYILVQRRYVKGVFGPWKILSFITPDVTEKGVRDWREQELALPSRPRESKKQAAVEAAS